MAVMWVAELVEKLVDLSVVKWVDEWVGMLDAEKAATMADMREGLMVGEKGAM